MNNIDDNEQRSLAPLGGRKRSDSDLIEDREVETRLYIEGLPVGEICAAINTKYAPRGFSISERVILSDISAILQQWREQKLMSYSTAINKELVRLDLLEAAYWRGVNEARENDRVSEELIETIDEIAFALNQVQPVKRSKKRTRSERKDEEWALKGIERVIDLRCRVMGLYAPQRQELDWRLEAKLSGIGEKDAAEAFEELVNRFVRKLRGDAEDGQIPPDPGPEKQ